MMGISLWLLWDRAADTARRRTAITLFFLQLALNAAWSPVFFGLHHTRTALAVIVLLSAAIAATILAAWRTQRMAAWLLVPYLAWVVYATTLNAGIVALNV
jgi:tryptophan-rich sensory protein